MSKWNVLAATAALLFSTFALATSASANLVVGGRTLAGPAVKSLAAQATATVYTDPDANADTCVTVLNTGSAVVRLSVIISGPSTSSIDVPVGSSGALCRDQTEQVDLTCLGTTTSCRASWRVDRD